MVDRFVWISSGCRFSITHICSCLLAYKNYNPWLDCLLDQNNSIKRAAGGETREFWQQLTSILFPRVVILGGPLSEIRLILYLTNYLKSMKVY